MGLSGQKRADIFNFTIFLKKSVRINELVCVVNNIQGISIGCF